MDGNAMEQDNSKLLELESHGHRYIFSGNTGLIVEVDDQLSERLQAPDELDDEIRMCLFGDGDYNKSLRILPARETALQNITVFTSNRCNLDCSYCYVTKNNAMNDEKMSIDTFKSAVDNLLTEFDTSKRINILFFGGEPLLNISFLTEAIGSLKKIEAEGKTKFSFSLTTNGTILSDKILDLILQYDISIVISIDGSQDVHDAMRPYKNSGRGSYDTIVKNVRKLAEFKKIKARVTLCDVDVDLVEMYEQLKSAGFWDVHLAIVADEETDTTKLKEKMDILRRRIGEMEAYIIKNMNDDVLVRFGDYLKYLKKIHLGFTPENRPMRFPCTAGHSSFSLATTGDYYLCHRFNNVDEYRLGDINHGVNPEIRDKFLQEHNVSSRVGQCKTCWASTMCGGTCYHPSYTHSGETRLVNELHCKYTREMVQSALRVYLGMNLSKRYLLENIH
ncbi:MAG: hypothetical protein DBP02_00740 [gamma proteobacterium symbiont of Ctena orbiculata]|nr:MAG: hypothetical protein DBP02_00740 [gamma proteobacterium symbiont of Ctena orbiculata]